MVENPLTQKQIRFVEEYLLDLNATQAAIRAGYSPNTANEQGARLLANVSIVQAVQEAQGRRAQRTHIKADAVLAELAAIAFFDPALLEGVKGPEDVAALPVGVRRAIVGWSWDKQGNFLLKLAPKTAGLELLGRHLGLFKERLEVSGAGGGAIETVRRVVVSPEADP